MGTSISASSKSTTGARGQIASQCSGSAATTEQKLSKDASASQPAIAAASSLVPQTTLPLAQSAGSQLEGAQADSDQMQATSSRSTQDSGGVQSSPASPGFADSSPRLETFDPAQTQAASVPSAETSDSSIEVHATDDPWPAESSSLPGKLGGAALQAASSPIASSVPPEQSDPAKGLQAADSSASESDLTSATEQVGQGAATVRQGMIEAAAPASATDHGDMAELPDLLGNFAGSEINAKVSGNESLPASRADEFTARVNPVAASKAESLVSAPGKTTLHSAVVSDNVVTEATGQQVTDPKFASAQVLSSASAGQAASSQLDANPQSPNAASPLPKDAAAGTSAIPPSGASYAGSSDGGAHTSLADASAGGGKPGQQNGQSSGDNPASVVSIAPSSLSDPGPDPAANLFGVHAPAATVTHTNMSAPQATPPPSAPATTLSAWQNYDGGAGSLVRSASLSGSANSAEMHVEFRSGVLGPLEVHTVMHDGAIGAEIHVQGQEAHTLLAAGLPSLERALGERNLRVENIAVYQDQAGGGMSGGGKQNPDSSPSPQHPVLPWDNLPQATNAASGSAEDEELANPAAGLSIRA
ncbi:MAG: flagellar hook-length control protein FliK [Terriglobia bacterium]